MSKEGREGDDKENRNRDYPPVLETARKSVMKHTEQKASVMARVHGEMEHGKRRQRSGNYF